MLFMRAMAAIKIEKSLTLSLLMTSSKKLVRPFTFPWYGSNNFWKIRKPLFLGRVSSRQRLLSLQRRKATEKCAPITLISPQFQENLDRFKRCCTSCFRCLMWKLLCSSWVGFLWEQLQSTTVHLKGILPFKTGLIMMLSISKRLTSRHLRRLIGR